MNLARQERKYGRNSEVSAQIINITNIMYAFGCSPNAIVYNFVLHVMVMYSANTMRNFVYQR